MNINFLMNENFLSFLGAINAWQQLILCGANTAITDKWDRTAKEVAELSGFSVSPDWNLESKVPGAELKKKVTAVLTHPMCVRHYTCPPSSTTSPQAPPENIRRLTVLLDEVLHCSLDN